MIKREQLFETLKERGYFYQFTNEAEVKKLLNGKEQLTAYIGIDPTADSLHIGHCFPLIVAKYLQDAGHRVIILLGGATAQIGDPSGKTDMRAMVSNTFVDDNLSKLKIIIGKFVNLEGSNPAMIVNNNDWFKDINFIPFMREIGVHFNVNKMLSSEAYSRRLEEGGLTFFEMSYMLMQAYDFVWLNQKYNCRLQFGGSDQWGNILAGADLGRKLSIAQGKDAETFQAFTNVLLTNAEGVKMGKTEKGALWVLKEKYSPYDFYQYFYNIKDSDVEKMLKLLTRITLAEISELIKGDIRIAKARMAYEVTKLVHGASEADKAVEASNALFGGGQDLTNVPTLKLDKKVLPANVIDFVTTLTNFVPSKSEARRLIEQGGLMVNEEKIIKFDEIVTFDKIKDNYILIKKGKKNFLKIEF